MTNKILLIFITAFIFLSCKLGTSGTFTNENIDKSKKEQIKILNDKLFSALSTNNVMGVKSLMSDKLIEKGGSDIEKLINQINSAFKSANYRILDEYNIQNSSTNTNNTLPSGLSGESDYVISYTALNKEMYVSLLLPTDISNEFLITVIYGKYGDDWKINILQFGQYSIFKKTAPEYYKIAKQCYEKSYLVDAINYIGLSRQCARPANELFKYQKEKEIIDFYDKIMNEVKSKYTFPMTLNNVESKPKIFRIVPEILDDGYAPMVHYLSNINLKDTVALKIENEAVKKEVKKIFTGIDKDKNYILYWAYNELPSENKRTEHFGFGDRLKE